MCSDVQNLINEYKLQGYHLDTLIFKIDEIGGAVMPYNISFRLLKLLYRFNEIAFQV